jgi:hypothetical protein
MVQEGPLYWWLNDLLHSVDICTCGTNMVAGGIMDG